jgi:hypothetical protein
MKQSRSSFDDRDKGQTADETCTHMPLLPGYTPVIPEIEVERRNPLADWQAGLEDYAVEISREIFLRFNWMDPNLDLTREMTKKLFARTR